MYFKISNKEISLFTINLVVWLSSISYVMLYNLAQLSYDLSETAIPEAQSGIYVMMLFARLIMVAVLLATFCYDVMCLGDAIRNYYKEKNKGWL
jgi:hypothetical protein